jgi:hypothetical protein
MRGVGVDPVKASGGFTMSAQAPAEKVPKAGTARLDLVIGPTLHVMRSTDPYLSR